MLVYVSVEGAGREARHDAAVSPRSPDPNTPSHNSLTTDAARTTNDRDKQGPAEDGLFLACAASDGYVRAFFVVVELMHIYMCVWCS